MKKRFLLTLLAIALVLSTVAVTVFAGTYTVATTVVSPKPTVSGAANEVITTGTATRAHALGDKNEEFNLPAYVIDPNDPNTKGVESKVSVSVVGTDITFTGVEIGMKIHYKRADVSTYTTVSLTSSNLSGDTYTISLEGGVKYDVAVTYKTVSNVHAIDHTDGHTYKYTYTFKQSAAAQVETVNLQPGDKWPTPDYLKLENGVITGMEAGKTYMYAAYNLLTGALGEYTEYVDQVLTTGVYSVYVAEGADSQYTHPNSDPVSLSVAGKDAGKLSFATKNGTAYAGKTSADSTPGTWTIESPLGNYAPAYVKSLNGFATETKLANQNRFIAGSYVYTFLEDEYVAANDFISFTFKKNNNQGDHIRTLDGAKPENVLGAVIIHVFDGEYKEYKVPFTWKAYASNTIHINAAEHLNGAAGLVYKLEFDFVDLSNTSVDVIDGATLVEALEKVNLRPAKDGKYDGEDKIYNELLGKSVTLDAGEYLFYKDGVNNGKLYVAEGGEFVKGPDGENLKYTDDYELKEGEYVTIHDENLFSDNGVHPLAGEFYVMTGCVFPATKASDGSNKSTVAFAGDYTYQEFNFVAPTAADAKTANAKLNEDLTDVIYTVRKPEAKPDYVYFEGNGSYEDSGVTYNKYLMKGLDAAKVYMLSVNGGEYTKIENVTEYEVEGKDGIATKYEYYVAAGAYTYDSEHISKNITGAHKAIADELTVKSETDSMSNTKYYVTGFTEAVANGYTVEYVIKGNDWSTAKSATMNAGDPDEGTPATDSIEVNNGECYLFRYKGSGNLVSGPAVEMFILFQTDTSLKGTVSLNPAKGTGLVTGAWTSSIGGAAYYDSGLGGRLAQGFTPTQDNPQAWIDFAYQYKFQTNEMFRLAELSSFKVEQLGFAGTKPFDSTYAGFARIHVINGDKEYYDIPVNFTTGFTVDVASYWSTVVSEQEIAAGFEPKGWVTAVEFHYFREGMTDGVSIVNTAANYAVFRIPGMSAVKEESSTVQKAFVSDSFVKLKEAPDLTQTFEVLDAVGTYGGEIIGLDPAATYQFIDVDAILEKDPAFDKNDAEQLAALDWSGNTYAVNSITGEVAINLPKGEYVVRCFALATDTSYVTSTPIVMEIEELQNLNGRDTVKTDKLVLPEDVSFVEADYTFDINESRWINRLAIANIVHESPDSTITFVADNYKYTVAVADIDLKLDTAHYFDMKVTFNGESAYDRMYAKMAAVADEKELIKGIHFETTTNFFFENATFEVYLGTQYDGYEVELRSFNERVNRLRSEETVTVEEGWATFSTFGGDYVIISPAYAADNQ